jgi:hypothetical protein
VHGRTGAQPAASGSTPVQPGTAAQPNTGAQHNTAQPTANQPTTSQPAATQPGATTQLNTPSAATPPATPHNATGNQPAVNSTTGKDQPAVNSKDQPAVNSKDQPAVNSKDQPNSSIAKTQLTGAPIHPGPNANHPAAGIAGHNRTTGRTNHHRTTTDQTLGPDNSANNGNNTLNPITNPVTSAFTLRSTGNLQPVRLAGAYHLTVDVKTPAAQKDTTKKQATAKRKTSFFYAGILGAPDFSTVHFQKMTGTGTTFGILLGYAFNDRWSIETGAYIDRKKYYTDGEYFSTKKITMPNYSHLLNVDGTCYMWEIPLNVRYNFNPAGGATRWFATAGLSTYLMNREKYNAIYSYYYGTRTGDTALDLRRPSQYPFSIINLSAGFEQRLGKVGNLRVEPYVRIPLGGIGTGSLPILSAGVNVGFTRRLWK